jgi:glycosyltransferase involved in cell wall biosynthesis
MMLTVWRMPPHGDPGNEWGGVLAAGGGRRAASAGAVAVFVAAHNGAHVWGGAERATALLLQGLQARGHRVRLFCNDPRVARAAAALGVPSGVLRIGGDVALPHALRFAAALRRDRPDVLLVGTWKKLFWVSSGARLAGVPRVVARVGLEGDGPRALKYRVALGHWVDAVVVTAAPLSPALATLPGWTSARVPVIHNAVHGSVRRLPPGAVRAALGIAAEAPVVGTVARLCAQKRLDRLLRAVALLPGDVHCVLAGEGRERAALAALADTLGIHGRVHFLGWREDRDDVLAALDVFAVTSAREGMCNAMLEALAAGVPVVSTPVCGAAEALEPLTDDFAPGVVTTGSGPAAVAEALRGVLGDPGRRSKMAAAARRVAAVRFDFGRMLDRWEAVLDGGAGARG